MRQVILSKFCFILYFVHEFAFWRQNFCLLMCILCKNLSFIIVFVKNVLPSMCILSMILKRLSSVVILPSKFCIPMYFVHELAFHLSKFCLPCYIFHHFTGNQNHKSSNRNRFSRFHKSPWTKIPQRNFLSPRNPKRISNMAFLVSFIGFALFALAISESRKPSEGNDGGELDYEFDGNFMDF